MARYEPSFAYGGGAGSFSYFVTGDFLRNDLGIESPDGSSNPIHDHTTQYHGFGYFEDILDEENRVALMLGSVGGQIPDSESVRRAARARARRSTASRCFPSQDLDENQREVTQFGALSWQHSVGALERAVLVHRALLEPHLRPGLSRRPAVHRHLAERLQAEHGLCAAKRRRLQARRPPYSARRAYFCRAIIRISDTASQVLPGRRFRRPGGFGTTPDDHHR